VVWAPHSGNKTREEAQSWECEKAKAAQETINGRPSSARLEGGRATGGAIRGSQTKELIENPAVMADGDRAL